MRKMAFITLLFAAVAGAALAGAAQSPADGDAGSATFRARHAVLNSGDMGQGTASPLPAEMERRQSRQQSEQRYADLKRDTDRLLQLATELKLQVDKAGEHTLSVEAIRKADEIEKLAHSVRNKMKAQ